VALARTLLFDVLRIVVAERTGGKHDEETCGTVGPEPWISLMTPGSGALPLNTIAQALDYDALRKRSRRHHAQSARRPPQSVGHGAVSPRPLLMAAWAELTMSLLFQTV
jgi:hypothetical protein